MIYCVEDETNIRELLVDEQGITGQDTVSLLDDNLRRYALIVSRAKREIRATTYWYILVACLTFQSDVKTFT